MLSRPKLLIICELGCLPLEVNAAQRFFHLVFRLYDEGLVLTTSNRSVGERGGAFRGPCRRHDNIGSLCFAFDDDHHPLRCSKPTKPQTNAGQFFMAFDRYLRLNKFQMIY